MFLLTQLAFADPMAGLRTLDLPPDAPIADRALRTSLRKISAEQRPAQDDLKLTPFVLDAVPVNVWLYVKEEQKGLAPGTPIVPLADVRGMMVVGLAPNGERLQLDPRKLSITPPASVVLPPYIAVSSDQRRAGTMSAYAAHVPSLEAPLATWNAEVQRFRSCADGVRTDRAGSVDPSQYDLVSYDRDGNVKSVKRWSEVIGAEIATKCDVARFEKADATFTALAVDAWNTQMGEVRERLQARLGGN